MCLHCSAEKRKKTGKMKSIFKVVQQGEAFAVPRKQNENGQTMKCNIVLQELGGKFEDQFAGTLLGNTATCKFYPGDVVAASLRFSTRDYNGATYQDVLVTEIIKIN